MRGGVRISGGVGAKGSERTRIRGGVRGDVGIQIGGGGDEDEISESIGKHGLCKFV